MENSQSKILDAIANNDAIVFIGFGVSVYTTEGQDSRVWKDLIKKGLENRLSLQDINVHDDFNAFDNNVEEIDDYYSQVDDCRITEKSKTRVDVFKLWLEEKMVNLQVKKPDLIKAIGDLNCPIFTTNYDLLLEEILDKKALTWNIYENEDIEVDFESMKNYVFHLYGHYKESKSITLNMEGHNEFALVKLKSLLETKTIIFIGYGSALTDPYFSHLLEWIELLGLNKKPIYKIINSKHVSSQLDDSFVFENVKTVGYGYNNEDIVSYVKTLKQFSSPEDSCALDIKKCVLNKYLNYLIDEYAHVSVFGYSRAELKLPLEKVYVDLRFDPTHPSIKAMKVLEIAEEFKRKLFTQGLFSEIEKVKIFRAYFELCKKSPQNINNLYRNFMMEQWVNVLLDNKIVFTKEEATSIKDKVTNLKKQVTENIYLPEAESREIKQIYNSFKHCIVLGHPGSGKTTLSKWMVVNMAKELLGKENNLFFEDSSFKTKLPILIPIWKYVTKINDLEKSHKMSLLQFIYENPTLDSTYFVDEEKHILSQIVKEYLVRGNALVILEGLDEIPIYMDRSDLMKEINCLIERPIDYDRMFNKLSHSIHEFKEVCGTQDPDKGNRFIITSRIEGNYFQEINQYIPRLTIEDMSNEALLSFCSSYMEAIKDIALKTGQLTIDYDTSQLYEDIMHNEDIFKLAINPQLASLIASVYTQYQGELPSKRIDLYEKAIEGMIERLISLLSSSDLIKNSLKNVSIDRTMLWSIMQEIADYLHNRTEGLTENTLKIVVKKYLVEFYKQPENIEDVMMILVDILKVHSGLLTEFGHNSFKFLHRTFQEYLSARNIIFVSGFERDEGAIYENIKNKIAIPNWRVPLSMTFGILSKSAVDSKLFDNIITKLFYDDNSTSNNKTSTVIVPFVLIESLYDMSLPSKEKESDLIQKISDLLFNDYKNLQGFSRLKEHRELIEGYFLKLKECNEKIVEKWFFEKLDTNENIACCASILNKLKWYNLKFHEIFLKNLHNDSIFWDWPIDTVLRYYATSNTNEQTEEQLKLKSNVISNSGLRITSDLLRLMVVFYGGYKNHGTPSGIIEYCEIASFLQLSENERDPFILYYQDVWGKDDPAYQMAYHLDFFESKQYWQVIPVFERTEIYKESTLTEDILSSLHGLKSLNSIKDELIENLQEDNFEVNEKVEALLALIGFGEYEVLKDILLKNCDRTTKQLFEERVRQLIFSLNDPVARCSSQIAKYLVEFHKQMENNPSKYSLKFRHYAKIFLFYNALSGGLPVNTNQIVNQVNDPSDKFYLFAEYLGYNLTSAYLFDRKQDIINALELYQGNSNDLINTFLQISKTVQLYKPTRTYIWPLDVFIFKNTEPNDIPISFLYMLENLNRNIAYVKAWVNNVFLNDELYIRNPNLLPIMMLFNFGDMSKYSKELLELSYVLLMPELETEKNKKEVLLNKIELISNQYYKSRALCQLALYYESKSLDLFTKSYDCATNIQNPSLKFQVFELLFTNLNYKDYEESDAQKNKKDMLGNILHELSKLIEIISDKYDKVTANVRLSFYYKDNERYRYLKNAIDILSIMEDEEEKIDLIASLKPLADIFDDLKARLKAVIDCIDNQEAKLYINSNFSSILLNFIKFGGTNADADDEIHINTLYSLYSQLNDLKSLFDDKKDINYLWKSLRNNPDDRSKIEGILEIGMKDELLLTHQAAIIIDELVQNGKETNISIILPYLVKPTNEILPTVYRWFNDTKNYKIKNIASILLSENKFIFASAIEIMESLLKCDNDQLRYRVQRVFQHPERDPKEPEKRISVIGENTIFKIFQCLFKYGRVIRVRAYLRSFFNDLSWDDSQVFLNIAKKIEKFKVFNKLAENSYFLSNLFFIDGYTWTTLVESIEIISYPSYYEEIFNSVVSLIFMDQIEEEDWSMFSSALMKKDLSGFKDVLYFTQKDLDLVQYIIEHARYFLEGENKKEKLMREYISEKIKNEKTCSLMYVLQQDTKYIKDFCMFNFRVSTCKFHERILDILNTIPVDVKFIENLIEWLFYDLKNFSGINDTHFDLSMLATILSIVAAFAEKDDYHYRKITNSERFSKSEYMRLLERALNTHPYFTARGSAFVLLAAMDKPDSSIILNSLNLLLDENVVKNYSVLAIPMIHLADEFIEDLLKIIRTESAVKAYEVLKILTEHAQNDKIDAFKKSKILNYLLKEIRELNSKKPVNFYYTDIKIPFTTTLEKELYRAWVKIQGLSGKIEYRTSSL